MLRKGNRQNREPLVLKTFGPVRFDNAINDEIDRKML